MLAVKDKIRDITYQLDHPPENPTAVAINYDKIKEMILEIERQQNQYCVIKDEYLAKYRTTDIHVRSIEHQASISKETHDAHVQRVNSLR